MGVKLPLLSEDEFCDVRVFGNELSPGCTRLLLVPQGEPNWTGGEEVWTSGEWERRGVSTRRGTGDRCSAPGNSSSGGY